MSNVCSKFELRPGDRANLFQRQQEFNTKKLFQSLKKPAAGGLCSAKTPLFGRRVTLLLPNKIPVPGALNVGDSKRIGSRDALTNNSAVVEPARLDLAFLVKRQLLA